MAGPGSQVPRSLMKGVLRKKKQTLFRAQNLCLDPVQTSREQGLKDCCQPRKDMPVHWLLWAFPRGPEAELCPLREGERLAQGDQKENSSRGPGCPAPTTLKDANGGSG